MNGDECLATVRGKASVGLSTTGKHMGLGSTVNIIIIINNREKYKLFIRKLAESIPLSSQRKNLFFITNYI